jgi:hypothetical protein
VTELREAALRYSARNIPVFPCRPQSKVPLTSRGFLDASAEQAQVWRWWHRWPTANIGIPCGPRSQWLVVDVDGDPGEATWAALEREHGPAPTLTAITGRGRHLIFQFPAGAELGCKKLGPHVDSRGPGGFVVAPPSLHPNGRTYRWDLTGPYVPQEPPRWLVEALWVTAAAPTVRASSGGVCVGGGVPAGLPRHLQAQAAEAIGADRSRQTYRLIVSAAEWGLDDDQVVQLALAHAPTLEKYGGRAAAEVLRILDRVRPDHDHEGKPCDVAGCPRAPRWMHQVGVI